MQYRSKHKKHRECYSDVSIKSLKNMQYRHEMKCNSSCMKYTAEMLPLSRMVNKLFIQLIPMKHR